MQMSYKAATWAWIRLRITTNLAAGSKSGSALLNKVLEALHDNLARVLAGETNSVKVLMENSLLDDLFASGILVEGAYSQHQHIIDLVGHKNPEMRVLEVGAGTGGATMAILEALTCNSTLKRDQEYVFTNSADWRVTEAQSRFSDRDGVVFEVLDILQDPVSQGFDADCFDLVVASGIG